MAASTSSAATLNFGTTPGVQNYFEELQRWEKETFEQMRQRKEEQRAKANDSLTRVQELLEQQKYSIQPSSSTHSKEAITTSNKENVPKTTSSNVVPAPENSSVTKVQTSRKVAVEDIPIQTQGQHALEKVVEQQMEKLMSDDKQVSFPTAHVVEESETQEPKCKIKRPFLKKGAGLQRFMPKPISYPKKTVRKESEKNNVQNSSKPVSLQPVMSEKTVNHDSDKEPPSPPFVETRLPNPRSLFTTAPASKSQALHSANGKSTEIGKSHIKEKTAPVLEKEAQELAQYEILEDYAHHVSFSSDSSLITDVLNSEDTKKDVPVPSETILPQELAHKFKFPEQRITDCNSVDPLTSTVEMLKQRKIELEDQMRNSDQRVKGLKKDVASTVPKRVLNVSLSSDDGDNISVSNSVETEPHFSNKNGDPEVTSSRALLREKLEEVQREIEVYQVECSIVKKLKMQRENELRNLQKVKEEFAKFKQEELDKLNKEIAEKRNQIRREKLTFERYQKLRSDLPGKKEREETSLLKQQYASLQEDMKKKSIKFNAEIKRLRKLLEAAEKDRDTLKIENQRLSERVDNLSISKTKQRERPSLVEMKPKTMISYNKEQNEKIKAKDDDDDKEEEESIEDPFVSEFSPLKDGVFEKDSKVSDDDEMEPKPHVRFNLDPEIQRFSPESYNSNYIEIQHGDKVERIYNNNERLILFKSGSRKFISADGQRIRFEFYNGDKEESFPNNMQVYTYANGVVERSYPDGLRIVEFPNKQVEKYFPDGTMQATYPNGVVITQRPDGIKETQSENGSVTTIFPSGIVVTKFCSGDKEIRSADFIRREFANGAIKTVYKTGRSETRYPDGRFRVKDRDGNVLYDNIMER